MTLSNETDSLTTQVDELRLQLAACGVAALSNTTESIKQTRLNRDSAYWTASYGDVCAAVDKQIELRDRQEETVRTFLGWLSADIKELHGIEVPRLADAWERFQCQQVIERGPQS